MNRANCTRIANAIAAKDNALACGVIDDILTKETGAHWIRDLTKLKAFLLDGSPKFSIMAKDGNGKLPFLAFSSLAGKGFCIGAGDCLSFCYSFKAWRYPAAFCRQAQNSALLQSGSGREHILDAIDKFEPV